jgi:hypothetical protein
MWYPSLFALLEACLTRTGPGRPTAGPARRKPASARLAVEALEDRTVPSSLAPLSPSGSGSQEVAALVSSSSHAQTFHASATFDHADNKGGTLVNGSSTPLGAFTGSFTQGQSGVKLTGTFTLNYGNSSLTCSYQMSLDRTTDQYVGTYQITGGTGALASASGGGSIVADHAGQGSVSLDGTLFR